MKPHILFPTIILLLVPATACMKAPDPSGASGPVSPNLAPAPEVDPDAARPEIEFDAPADWQEEVADQEFYLAKWRIPGADPGTCTVTWLGPNTAMRQPNIDRWVTQFTDIPQGDEHGALMSGPLEDGRYPGTLMRLEGTLTATRQVGGGEARENWMLLGAILDTRSGPIYIKALGPADVLHDAEEAFFAAVQQARILP